MRRPAKGATRAPPATRASPLWQDGASVNMYWGYLTRAGFGDKSHLLRQIEKYADVYCAKVTNLDAYTPFHHFRAAPVDLAHTMLASSPDI